MIFFDLDGTLLDHGAAARGGIRGFYARYSESLPYSSDEIEGVWHALIEKYAAEHFRGVLSWEDQRRYRIREIFQKSKEEMSDAEADACFETYRVAYEEHWTLFPDVVPCLDALRGRPIGVITNGPVKQQTRKLRDLRILDRFEVVVTSEEVGVAKPDPEIFLEACRRAGKSPGDCVYIGDRLDSDAEAASAVGLRGFWLNRSGQTESSETAEIVSSLDEFLVKLNL